MHWKYYLTPGDLVKVSYGDMKGWGTVRGWIRDKCPPEDVTFDEVELSDFTLYIKSGSIETEVTLDQITDYVNEEDRETDIPLLSEEFRLTDGIDQSLSSSR
jgi:hypothetical protein